MSKHGDTLYWDTCIFLAWLKGEKPAELNTYNLSDFEAWGPRLGFPVCHARHEQTTRHHASTLTIGSLPLWCRVTNTSPRGSAPLRYTSR